MGIEVFFVCLFSRSHLGCRAKGWIPHHHPDVAGQFALAHLFEKAGFNQSLALQGGKEFPCLDNGLRGKFLAHREAETECGEFDRVAIDIRSSHPLHEFAQHLHRWSFPIIVLAPVKNQPFEGFYKEYAGATRRIEHDLIALLQAIHPIQCERLLQHQAGEEGRRVNAGRLIFNEELVDVADEFHRQIVEGIEPPKSLLPA